jgi:hypothetical protein
MGLVTSAYILLTKGALPHVFEDPSYIAGLILLAVMTWMLVKVPLANAGRADEPAPPAAMM